MMKICVLIEVQMAEDCNEVLDTIEECATERTNVVYNCVWKKRYSQSVQGQMCVEEAM